MSYTGTRYDWLRRRCERVMSTRPPDFVIGGREQPYMERWFIARSRWYGGCYLHRISRDDDDRALHDHPWPSLSLCLKGCMREIYAPRGSDPRDPDQHRDRYVFPGDVIFRGPRFSHRLEVMPGCGPVVTLFLIGPRLREWGFWCPQGWRRWQDFVAADDPGGVGRGCE